MWQRDMPIICGTDTPFPYLIPGFSLHDELGLMVDAGLTPYAALRAATRDAAVILRMDHDLGSIEPGKVADLVAVRGNPIQDIFNIHNISQVIHNGNLISNNTLRRAVRRMHQKKVNDPVGNDIWLNAGWLPDRLGIVYRPLSLWSFALNYRFNEWLGMEGSHVLAYHIVSIFLHAVASCMLFALLLCLPVSGTAGLIAACLFAVHPVHTEAVAGLIGRAEMLAFIFGMMLLSFHRQRRSIIGCSLVYLLAMWSKESGFLFFPLVIGMDLMFPVKGDRRPRRRYVGYVAVAVGWLILRAISLGGEPRPVPFIDNPIIGMTWFQGLITALSVQLEYLRTFSFPIPLSSDYSYNQLPIISSVVNYRVILFIILFCTAVWLSWKTRRRHPIIGFCVLGYAILFGATANIVMSIGTIMGERLMYAPSAMLCLLVGYGVWLLHRKLKTSTIYVATGALGVLCIIITISRNTTWKDELTFFRTQTQTAPNSAKAYYNLGATYAKQGDDEAAVASYKTSLTLFPYYSEPLYNMGNSLRRMKVDPEQVIAAYRDAIKYDRGHRKARANLAEYLLGRGKSEEAGVLISELKSLEPDYPTLEYLEIRLNQMEAQASSTAVPESMRNGILAYANGEYNEAILRLEQAVQENMSPNIRKTALTLLARSFEALGNPDRAAMFQQQADSLGLSPDMQPQ